MSSSVQIHVVICANPCRHLCKSMSSSMQIRVVIYANPCRHLCKSMSSSVCSTHLYHYVCSRRKQDLKTRYKTSL